MDDAEHLRAGRPIRTAPMWLNVLCTDTATVDAYLDHPIVLVDQPDQVQSRVKAKHNAFLTEWQEAALRGDSFPAQQEACCCHTTICCQRSSTTPCCCSAIYRAGWGSLSLRTRCYSPPIQ